MTRKSILITGCSSGIGYDAAHTLHNRGWRVFATCRKQEDCDRLSREGLESFVLDQSDTASMSAAIEETLTRTGGTLDALFNNAAFGFPAAVEDVPTDALRSIFETNLFGYHELTRQVIPVMRAQGHGRILNCSSVLGFVALKFRGAYNSTKFAMEGLTDTLRVEMRGSGINVILIQPGPITSKLRQNSIPHFEKWIDWRSSARKAEYEEKVLTRLYEDRGPDTFELPASAVSDKVWRALTDANPKARYKITTPTYLMAVLKRILPTRLVDWLIDRM
ncbi:short-subunit dehydrogenase [Litoreibacter meonggei]|uniref:Short-subunit dehydrogenase n=1 Tax=Litoreibacter meonggei TaxID=1049199 RepID=A0A497VBD4_9RHOB|nr:SDR family NAD(P)-dependent oxidoreductase [Litoreibacter meonggei]RLJ40780.1 short-subunit dehydrogenase [Litoreibacter meonggei]